VSERSDIVGVVGTSQGNGDASRTAADVHARADWRRVEELYRQVSKILNDEEKANFPAPAVVGALAEQLGRTFAHYEDAELDFIEDALVLLSEVDNLDGERDARFEKLYRDPRFDRIFDYSREADRRRPKPFEAIVETARRLNDLNRVREALVRVPTSGILGGSVSYGRFFNVCGGLLRQQSDTDLVLVVPEYGLLEGVTSQLAGVHGVNARSLELLRRRVTIHEQLRRDRGRCIFSHKLSLWAGEPDPLMPASIPSEYSLSLHVMSVDDFDYVSLGDLPILEAKASGELSRDVLDYRDTEPQRQDNQRAFTGEDIRMPLKADKVELGYVARVRVCHIERDRYFPGLHQNLLLPQFEARWESPETRVVLRLLSFRWKLLERLAHERTERPFEHQRLSLSHARVSVFAPHVQSRADRE
jgi:hypothetical protein